LTDAILKSLETMKAPTEVLYQTLAIESAKEAALT